MTPAPRRLRQLPHRLRRLVRAAGTAVPVPAAAVPAVVTVVRRHGTPKRVLAALLAIALPAAVVLAASGNRPDQPGAARWAAAPEPADRPTPSPGAELAPERPGEPPRPAGTRPQVRPADPYGDFAGWALLDLSSGTVTGSGDLAEVSTTASMVKAWIVADYLRLATEAGTGPDPERLGQLREIIRDSHNAYTDAVFTEIGAHASIERMIGVCGLTDSQAVPDRWSNTRMSPRDTARLGACLAGGRAAGPEWTNWLLDEMRAVRGIGDFGIRHAFPPGQRAAIAIKNGWVVRDDQQAWHLNCLAIGDGWTMGIMTRYPEDLGYQHGAELCRSLAAEHL